MKGDEILDLFGAKAERVCDHKKVETKRRMNPLNVVELLEKILKYSIEKDGEDVIGVCSVALVCKRWRNQIRKLLDVMLVRITRDARFLDLLNSVRCQEADGFIFKCEFFSPLLQRLCNFAIRTFRACDLLMETLNKLGCFHTDLIFPRAVEIGGPVEWRIMELPSLVNRQEYRCRWLHESSKTPIRFLSPLLSDLQRTPTPKWNVQDLIDCHIVHFFARGLIFQGGSVSFERLHKRIQWCDLPDAVERAEASYLKLFHEKAANVLSKSLRRKQQNRKRDGFSERRGGKVFK